MDLFTINQPINGNSYLGILTLLRRAAKIHVPQKFR